MEENCRCQLVVLVCAMFCTEKKKRNKRKTKQKENKSVDELEAEKTESYILEHEQDTFKSACSHWLLWVSARYTITVPFTLHEIIRISQSVALRLCL